MGVGKVLTPCHTSSSAFSLFLLIPVHIDGVFVGFLFISVLTDLILCGLSLMLSSIGRGRGKSLWMMPMSLKESRSIRLSSMCWHTRAEISWAEFDPYIGLTKNGELSSCYSTVIWLIRSTGRHLMPFLLALFTGMMLTDVPESATQTSYLFVDLPRTLPLILGEALFFFNLDISILFIISVSA